MKKCMDCGKQLPLGSQALRCPDCIKARKAKLSKEARAGKIAAMSPEELKAFREQEAAYSHKQYMKKVSNRQKKPTPEDKAAALVGQTFGVLRVIAFDGKFRTYEYNGNQYKRYLVRVVCDRCGRESELAADQLRPHKYCGFCNTPQKDEVDLTGQRFHDLTVLGRVGEWAGVGKTIWRVRCEACGKESTIDGAHLGTTRTCCGMVKGQKLLQANRNVFFAEGTLLTAIDGRREINKNNTSGHTGVCKHGDMWRAYINFRRKQYDLGLYSKLEDAVAARKAGEEKIYGDFLKWFAETYPEKWEKINKEKER